MVTLTSSAHSSAHFLSYSPEFFRCSHSEARKTNSVHHLPVNSIREAEKEHEKTAPLLFAICVTYSKLQKFAYFQLLYKMV